MAVKSMFTVSDKSPSSFRIKYKLFKKEIFISLVILLEYELNQAAFGNTFRPANNPTPLSIHHISSVLYRLTLDSLSARKHRMAESLPIVLVFGYEDSSITYLCYML